MDKTTITLSIENITGDSTIDSVVKVFSVPWPEYVYKSTREQREERRAIIHESTYSLLHNICETLKFSGVHHLDNVIREYVEYELEGIETTKWLAAQVRTFIFSNTEGDFFTEDDIKRNEILEAAAKIIESN